MAGTSPPPACVLVASFLAFTMSHVVLLQYVWGSYLKDLWALDMSGLQQSGDSRGVAWRSVTAVGDQQPESRTLHASASFQAGAVQGALYFGGLVSRPGGETAVSDDVPRRPVVRSSLTASDVILLMD